jgi:hypothetical protein
LPLTDKRIVLHARLGIQMKRKDFFLCLDKKYEFIKLVKIARERNSKVGGIMWLMLSTAGALVADFMSIVRT